jgi:hypothetical protein
MDYEELTMELMGWPHELSVYVRKPDGSLKASEIEPDDRCGLGKWIRTEGAVHRSLPEYSKLMDAHARIHQVTADIVRHADAGTLAATALDDKGEFKVAFVTFLSALMGFRQNSR